MNPSMNAYMLLVDTRAGLIKAICYGKNLEDRMATEDRVLDVSYLRSLTSGDGKFLYQDLFTFTNDESYTIPKERIIGLSKLSTTHSLAFMDYLQRTNGFQKAKEIPYFENHSLFSPRN